MTHVAVGTWKAHVTDAHLGQNQRTGTEYISVLFTIEDGPSQGTQIEWKGWLSDNAAPYTVQGLRNCGWVGDDIDQVDGPSLPAPVSLVIEEEADQRDPRKKYSRVRYVNRRGAGKLERGAAKALSSRLRGLCRDTPTLGPAKPQLSGAAATPQEMLDDDDIAF